MENKMTIRTEEIGKTGELCPASGIWEVVGNKNVQVPITKSHIFPPYNGIHVYWKLKHYI